MPAEEIVDVAREAAPLLKPVVDTTAIAAVDVEVMFAVRVVEAKGPVEPPQPPAPHPVPTV